MLASAAHEVVLASNGREGADAYRDKPADLVITDLFMPDQEGLETIMELRRHFQDAVIIAMSGKAAGIPPPFSRSALGGGGDCPVRIRGNNGRSGEGQAEYWSSTTAQPS